MSYAKVGTYKGWAVWQKDALADYVYNMKLELEKKSTEKADIEAEVSEIMDSKLAAFPTLIKEGPTPSEAVAPAVPVAPTLSLAEKALAQKNLAYITTNLSYLKTATKNVPDLASSVSTLEASVASLNTTVKADPPASSSIRAPTAKERDYLAKGYYVKGYSQ